MAFYKTEMLSRQLDSFCSHQDEIYASLSPYSDCAELSGIKALCHSFRRKSEDFFKENRKYNVAVIGQVKAGKTSFLNTLLFGGEEVLPKDAVPKTAALTRIEYAPQNSIEVEYYSPEDWVWLKRLAVSRENSDRAKAAVDTVIQAETSGLPVQELIFEGGEIRNFDSVSELTGELNEYVGENGRYTPLVKAATLRLNIEALKDISVVDTPGLNDPIPSRTERTREFIETCDAAFFLSRASYFLDRNDMELLTAFLPQKGVRRLILMASQFDSAILDMLYDCGDLDTAAATAKRQLTAHAERSIEVAGRELRMSGCSPHVIEVVEQCRRPVFFSAMADNISKKPADSYTAQERTVREGLEYCGPLSDEKLKEIGNMDEVRGLFASMLEDKDRLLERKAAAMAVVGQSDLRSQLTGIKKQVEGDLEGQLKARYADIQRRLDEAADEANALRDAVGAAFIEYCAPLEERLTAAGVNLRSGERSAEAVKEKRAMAVETSRQTVSDSVFYKPWTWGKSHVEVTSSETSYTYMDSGDVVESVRQAANEAELLHEAVFAPFADMTRLGNRLTLVITDDLARTGHIASAEDTERWVKIAKSRIVLPKLKVDPTPYIVAINERFPKQLRTQAFQNNLKAYAEETLGSMTDGIIRQLDGDAAHFKASAENAEARFCSLMLADRAKETAELREALAEVGGELHRRRELLEIIEQYI